MTSQEVGVLILVGLAMVLYGRRKKRQTPPPARGEMFFVETIEFIEVRSRPKAPEKAPAFLVNLAIVAGIVAFIWVMNR